MSPAPNKLLIDQRLFLDAFGRDTDYHDIYPQSIYLDLGTGDLYWAYDEDEDAEMDLGVPAERNAALRRSVADAPDRYLAVPGLTHGEHHDILREFLDSEWTESEGARLHARNCYFGSIGGWKREVQDDEVLRAYEEFRDRAKKRRAVWFLHDHGVEFEWK